MTNFQQPAASRTKAIRGLRIAMLALFAALVELSCASAQAPPRPSNDSPAGSAAASSPQILYRLPSSRERFHQYLANTLGPSAAIGALAFSAAAQSRNAPPEWGQGARGFAERFGSNFGYFAMEETTRDGMAAALREDTEFHRCGCSGVFPRVVHGLFSSVTARASDGRSIVSVPGFVAPYAAGFAATAAWYPSRFGPKDSLRWGTLSLGINSGIGILREFLPSRR